MLARQATGLTEHRIANSRRRSTPTSTISLRQARGPTLRSPLARQCRERAALAITLVLVVDPVVRVDALQRNVVTRAQDLHQNPPRIDLRLRCGARHVGIIAGELDANRRLLVDLVKGFAV